MAKKKSKEPAYEYVRAIVDCGNLSWEYKLEGRPEAAMSHDEDVEEWTKQDIIRLTRSMLDVPADFDIVVEYA